MKIQPCISLEQVLSFVSKNEWPRGTSFVDVEYSRGPDGEMLPDS